MRIFQSQRLVSAVSFTCSRRRLSARWRGQLDWETGSPLGEGDQDQKVSSLSLSLVRVCDLILYFRSFSNNRAVADNHQFLHEAYVSDDLVRAIHRFMKLYPKGIPLTDFTTKFEVNLLLATARVYN